MLKVEAIVLVSSMLNINLLSVKVDDTNWRAVKFKAAGSDLDVSSINVRGYLNAGSGSDLLARIYSHNSISNRPKDPIGGTFDVSSLTGGPIDYTFPISTPGSTVLVEDTTYWLVLGTNDATFDFRWTYTILGGLNYGVGSIFETVSTCSNCYTGGTSWSTSSSPLLTSSPKFAVNTVPEPYAYSYVFGLLSLVGVIGMRFFQKRQSSET